MSLTRVSLSLAALALVSLPALAQQKLLPEQSEIAFVARQMGVPLEGKFRKFDAQVSFDVAKPQTSKIAFTVDVGSATLGSDRYHGLSVGVSGGADQLTYSVRAQTVGTAGFSATNPRVGASSYNADRDGFRQQSLSANLGLGLSKGWRIEGNLLRSDGVSRYDDGVAASGVSKDTRAELTTQVAGMIRSRGRTLIGQGE